MLQIFSRLFQRQQQYVKIYVIFKSIYLSFGMQPYEIFGNKKKNKIDEEPQSKSKKNKKDRNRARKEQQLIQAQQEIEVRKQKNVQSKRQKLNKAMQYLRNAFPDHTDQALQKALIKFDQNLQETYNYILDNVPPDKLKQPPPEVQKADQFMNEMFEDENLQFDKNEFQLIFQQIANLLKQKQSQTGLDQFDINEFIDECQQMKKALKLVLRQEIDSQEEIQLAMTEAYEKVVAQTEQFKWQEILKKEKQQQKRRQQFPTLGQTMPKKGGQNIIDKIKQEKKPQSYEDSINFYAPGTKIDKPVSFKKAEKNSIYDVDNRFSSQKDIEDLSKQYNGIEMGLLKLIYKRLGYDYNSCRVFLERYYSDRKTAQKKVIKIQNPYISSPPKKTKSEEMEMKLKIKQEYLSMSLKQLRSQIDHLFKKRQVIVMTKNKIANLKTKKELQRLSSSDSALLSQLIKASLYKLIQEKKYGDISIVDLHGYRVQEIDNTLDQLDKLIKNQYEKANPKIVVHRSRGRNQFLLTIITGWGRHSYAFGRTLLKPQVIEWCQSKGYFYSQQTSGVKVYIRL